MVNTITILPQRQSNQTGGLTKSARRRLRRERRLLESTNVIVSQPQVNQGQGRSRNARRRRARQRNGRFMGGNPYLDTLLDPEGCPGVKVPDMVSFPSSTFQLAVNGALGPATGGDGCDVWICPFIGTGATHFPIYTGQNASPGGDYTHTGFNWAQRATVAGLYDQFRPVSAVLYAEYIGKSTDDSGSICCGIIPRTGDGPDTTITNFTTALNQPFTKVVPIRQGCYVLWKPQDNLDMEYTGIGYSQNASEQYWPQIFFCTSGSQVATNIRYRAVVNFEAIPTADTYQIVSPQPSPVAPNMLNDAMTWAGQAINNMGSLMSSVSPFVQPVLSNAAAAAAPLVGRRLGNAMGRSLGASMRLLT